MAAISPTTSTGKVAVPCSHCGQECHAMGTKTAGKTFCCAGCRQVYHLIHQCELGDYYKLHEGSAHKSQLPSQKEFEYLRDPEIRRRFIDFENNIHYRASLHIPNIHCTACVYLLERLQRFIPEIMEARVDYLRKELQVKVSKPGADLPELARLLVQIGYPPEWQTDTKHSSKNS